MKTVSPYQAGVRNADIQEFLATLNKGGVNMHSVLMARHGKIFFEAYWEPFKADTLHRM